MRKLFSFRSSSNNGTSNSIPPAPDNEKIYWETPWGSGIAVQDSRSESPSSSTFNREEQHPEILDSATSDHRGFSTPSPIICGGSGEKNLNVLSDLNRSLSGSFNAPLQVTNCPIRCRSLTPEKQSKTKQSHRATCRTYTVEKLESSSSSRGYPNSIGNSPYSSPVPLRCRSARLPQVSNKLLDLYIDGEQQENHKTNSRGHSPGVENDAPIESRQFPSLRRPPRAQLTAPSSPADRKVHLRSSSFREGRDRHFHLVSTDCTRDDARPPPKYKFAKNVAEKLSKVLPKKTKVKYQDLDSETTATVEDIFEDYAMAQKIPLCEQISLCKLSDIPFGNTNGCGLEEISDPYTHTQFPGDGSVGVKPECGDEELVRKGKEAEERVLLLSKELEYVTYQNRDMSMVALLQKLRTIADERLKLAREVSTHITSRITERASVNKAIRLAKVELDLQRRRMEKEKNELQSSLERELDRRSSDWSSKLEKFKSEEKRLRDRVRDLAEHNVSLQKEVQCLTNREAEAKTSTMHSEIQLNHLVSRLEEAGTENCNLRETLSKLQERSKGVEMERDCIRRSYKEKEKENKELQTTIVRLQRTCNEQEKTICGLQQGLSDDISKKMSLEKDDHVGKLQKEQVRLTGLELMLRKELESCRFEVVSLRRENIDLLDRLKGVGNDNGFSLFKLDQELLARVDCLQSQGLSLLDENVFLCSKLLELLKNKACQGSKFPSSDQGEALQETTVGLDDYSIVEFDMKVQSFKRGSENFRRSLQMISAVLHDKPSLESYECQSQSMDIGSVDQLKYRISEGDAEFELKAEILLTRVLREKLYSKERELEQLQMELATSIRSQDILKCEIQRVQDVLSCLTLKMKDFELQMTRKDETLNHIQRDLQECTEELTVTRGILQEVSKERDLMREKVQSYSERTMLLNREVISLKKKIEALDEDILVKEGQITILKDSLGNKPFDILYSPKSMQEFALERSVS